MMVNLVFMLQSDNEGNTKQKINMGNIKIISLYTFHIIYAKCVDDRTGVEES